VLPEKVAKFWAAAPAEHEMTLLNAIASVGSVHLESELSRVGSVLPDLLVDVLEGRINYANLNVEEALEVSRRVLRPGDPFLSKLEDKVKELKNVELVEKILGRLEVIGVSPDSFGKPRLGVVTDFVMVADENVHDALSELAKAEVIARRARVSPQHHVLVLVYSTNKSSEVERIKKRYSLNVDLPRWFYEPLDSARRRAEEEKTRIRKEIIEILVEIAGVLRDAFEFERAARLDIVSNALRAIENAEKSIEDLEEVFSEIIAFYSICGGKRIIPANVGLRKPVYELAESLIKGEKVSPHHFKEALSSLFSQEELAKLEDSLIKYNNLHDLSDVLSASQLGEKDKLGVQAIAALEGQQDLESLRELLIRRTEAVRNSLLISVVARSLQRNRERLEKILEILGKRELQQIYSNLSKLKGKVPQRSLPEGDAYSFLKSLVSLADELSGETSYLRGELELIKELPFEDAQERLQDAEKMLLDATSKFIELLSYKSVIEAMFRAQPLLSEIRVFRSRRITVAEGYVPVKYVPLLEETLKARVPRLLYFKYSEIPRASMAPTYSETRGLKKYLYRLTSMRGTPAYWEIDPTFIFTTLFVIMYGMMFGDVGHGLVLLLFGAFLLKTKYRLLGISREGAASLGTFSILAGLSSIAFGCIYGCMFFLKPLAEPIIAPIHDVYGIIAVALWFGVAQLMLALSLNILNLWLYGDKMGALFGGMSGAGLAFYGAGIVIAYRLTTSGFNFAVLSSPDLSPFVVLLAFALLCAFGSGVFEYLHFGEKSKVMHAVSEVIEMIIAFPVNSLSYIRLAAFAMAHEVFGILAENMTSFAGPLASYLVANLLVLVIEGLAAGIQAMRLIYYEFSTKFFKGTGVEFIPVSAPLGHIEKISS
jgi:V/A-type H+-transporting ATPase subunit I